MTAAAARSLSVGDLVTLKRDNPYGMPTQVMTVTAITYKGGYVTPWIHTPEGAFRPKDVT